MLKTRCDSSIKIWTREVVNKFEDLPESQKEFEVIQIQYAYDDKFIVEIIRPERKKERTSEAWDS